MTRIATLGSYVKRLGVCLDTAVAASVDTVEDSDLAVLYSAGVDSSVLAKICQDLGRRPLLLSVGTRQSRDRNLVELSKAHFDLPIEFVEIPRSTVVETVPLAGSILQQAGIHSELEELNLIHLSLATASYLACQAAQERGIKLLVTAQGADALLAGFDRYQRVPPDKLQDTLREDVQIAIDTGLVRDNAVGAAFSIEFTAPYLRAEVIEFCHKIPIHYKLSPEANKLVLRQLARVRGLPGFIADRPKKSMQ